MARNLGRWSMGFRSFSFKKNGDGAEFFDVPPRQRKQPSKEIWDSGLFEQDEISRNWFIGETWWMPMIVSCASKSTRKVKGFIQRTNEVTGPLPLRRFSPNTICQNSGDERKLLDLDGKGNRDAKLDHRRFWRGFIHNKIGNYEDNAGKQWWTRSPSSELMYFLKPSWN